jgi:hypothetical protein
VFSCRRKRDAARASKTRKRPAILEMRTGQGDGGDDAAFASTGDMDKV